MREEGENCSGAFQALGEKSAVAKGDNRQISPSIRRRQTP